MIVCVFPHSVEHAFRVISKTNVGQSEANTPRVDYLVLRTSKSTRRYDGYLREKFSGGGCRALPVYAGPDCSPLRSTAR